MEKVSIVTTTYGRLELFKKLINSIRESRVKSEDYEILVISSDPEDCDKVKWIREQKDIDITLFSIPDRTTVRTGSLMYYENIGIKNSKYEWIFVVSDDMWFEPDWYEKFLTYKTDKDKIYIPSCHIASKHYGFWIPEIGNITKDGVTEPMWLYDISIIHSSLYKEIGYQDEQIHWFGKGADLPIAVAFLTDQKPVLCHDIKIGHEISAENRTANISTTPNGNDFDYITKKWLKWIEDNNKNYSFYWPWDK